MMAKMFQWSREKKMMVDLQGDPTVDPDLQTPEDNSAAVFGGGDIWTASAPTVG